jgi:hypothetical protein
MRFSKAMPKYSKVDEITAVFEDNDKYSLYTIEEERATKSKEETDTLITISTNAEELNNKKHCCKRYIYLILCSIIVVIIAILIILYFTVIKKN